MKKHISRSRGMNTGSSGFLKTASHWLQSIRTRAKDIFIREDVKEKINNSKLSWEERLLLMGLIIVAGITLLGIKLYENNRTYQQAYTQLDQSRLVMMETEQLRVVFKEMEPAQSITSFQPALAKSLSAISSIKKHSLVQENRIKSIQQMLQSQQALTGLSQADWKTIYSLLDGMKAEEQRNLEMRKADITLGYSIDQRLYILLLVTLVLLVVLAGYVLYKNQLATLQAKQQLENNKLILQSIIDNSSSLVYVKDMLGRFIFTNKRFTEFYGKTGEHLNETPDETVLESRKSMESQEDLIINEQAVHFYAIRFPLLDKFGQVYATAGIFTNLTDMIRKQQESKEKELLRNTLAVQENERLEIGMELHDNITQLLASAKMMLDTAIRQTKTKDEHLEKARDDVFTAIHETRKLSHSLVVPGLETESLTDAIMRLLDRLKADNRMLVQLKLVSKKKLNTLDASIRLALYRILQEQVNNIVKHAEATQVLVDLKYLTDSIQLTIQDNGVGFDPEVFSPGIGLSNINRRVSHLGGECRVHSVPGQGCQLNILIPQ
ncbi:sensor histidine kinase [Flavihumibacter sp. UBA7668]|uniref:sensor histidine kinase n=1 Tax=Flavihumibacter sp. UBA7668 TaxID=1946542 RepID=UPI0025BC8DE8|nr:ATP-binding protein [Flavihumibacter sp. UBA7668]